MNTYEKIHMHYHGIFQGTCQKFDARHTTYQFSSMARAAIAGDKIAFYTKLASNVLKTSRQQDLRLVCICLTC